MRLLRWPLVGLAVLSSSSARAAGGIDLVENIFGASNVNAVTGNGRLALGVSRDGDWTVLSWPSPSYCDQLAYIASNAPDVRTLPRYGAPEGAGAFVGLVLDGASGREVTWLRDRAKWTISQGYGASDGPNVSTVFARPALGLTVTVVDAVAPHADGAADVLVRQVTVEKSASSAVTQAWLVTFANLSPQPKASRVPELPLVDWGLDGRNDFAAVWDDAAKSAIHFHPKDRNVFDKPVGLLSPAMVDYGPIGKALASATVDDAARAAIVAKLDADYGAGTYLALTSAPDPDQHQIGYDATPLCATLDGLLDNVVALPKKFPGFALPFDPKLVDALRCAKLDPVPKQQGWKYQAADALADAADGELSGSGIAAGEVDLALRTPLSFSGGKAVAAIVLAAADSAKDARAAALAAKQDPAAVAAAAEKSLGEWIAKRRLPDKGGEAVRTIARRSLINLRVGTDAATGAVVASIARQAPYGLDWPRDGSFFNLALDISGQSDLVDRRVDLYRSWQRKMPVPPTVFVDVKPPLDPDSGEEATYPAGAWEMNYYADGIPGGNDRFEIDETAFALWTIVAHAGWTADARAYLDARWDGIAAAADLLARWRDPATLLHAPAQEDDNAAYTQTLHGAITTFGALDIAGRAARLVGRDADAERWEARSRELRGAILARMYDPAAGVFVSVPGTTANPGSSLSGPTAWLVFPFRLLPYDDARVAAQLRHDLDLVEPTIKLETDGGAYYMKNAVSLALAAGPEIADRTRALLPLLTKHPSADTHQFGEVMVMVTDASGRHPEQRVSNPHLWEGTLFYLTAMALEDRDAFFAWDRALPPSRAEEPPPTAGCGCRLVPAAPIPSRAPLALLAIACLAARFSRRSTTR